jgi:hypothetical protein
MASRKEEKERLRKEREERERKEEEQSKKKKRRLTIGGAVLAVVIVGVVAALVLSGGGKKGGSAAANEGLQVSAGPWEPVVDGLEDREKALQLPPPSETIYHVHAQLKVFINGKPSKVPFNIGIDQGKGFLSSLHTHDEKGIVHMEAVEPYPFTLAQFMTVWGVKFTETQLGSYRPGGGLVLETYVNGEKVPSGPRYEMKQSDRIVIGFGKPGSFPKDFELDPAAGQ